MYEEIEKCREHSRKRLRNVCEKIPREGWVVVLLSELKADKSGMV